MNEQSDFERYIADQLGSAAVGTPPASAIEDTIARAGGSRRLPEWLVLIKESPMRMNSHVAVGSPIAQVMAIVAATLLLAVALAAAGAGAQRLLAAGPIVVAQDGSGDYATINEAVAVAQDGDEILVKPGTYVGSVLIDKDVTLRGDGTREDVILEFTADGPTIPSWGVPAPYGVMLVDTEAAISDLTVRGPNIAAAFVFVGGAPTLENVANELEGDFSGDPHTSVAVVHGAGGTIRDSLLDGPVFDFSGQRIPGYEDISGSGLFVAEDNALDVGFGLDVTDGSTFLRNTITDDGGLDLGGTGTVLVEGNDAGYIELRGGTDGFVIQDNLVREGGIVLGPGTATVEGNVVTGAQVGIQVARGASPTITGNLLEGTAIGILIDAAESAAVIEDNRFCGNDRNLVVDGSEAQLDPSNEVCDSSGSE